MRTAGEALRSAAQHGHLDELREGLAGGTPVDPFPPGEDSPLCYAVMFGQLAAARLLLDAGANVNHPGQQLKTPLHCAVRTSLALTELVLARRPDLRVRDSSDLSVLDEFIFNAPYKPLDVHIVDRLLAAGFDLTTRGTKYAAQGRSPLALACSMPHLPTVERLVAAGMDVNEGSPPGRQVLQHTLRIREDDKRAVMLGWLVRHGLHVNAADSGLGGFTVLMAMVKLGALEAVRDLLQRGADPNVRIPMRGTALSLAEERGDAVLVDLLLEFGAKPDRPALAVGVGQAVEAAREAALASPDDPARRLAYARALQGAGRRAAAFVELSAATRPGTAPPEDLRAALTFENPPGVRWTFVDFLPPTNGVAPATEDARYPGARVTDGTRTLPLVLAMCAPCTKCDDACTVPCPECHGTGTRAGFLNPDHEYECEPRVSCGYCGGTKFSVGGRRGGKGPCAHAERVEEAKAERFTLARCTACGLAALPTAGNFEDVLACGTCGRLDCTCPA